MPTASATAACMIVITALTTPLFIYLYHADRSNRKELARHCLGLSSSSPKEHAIASFESFDTMQEWMKASLGSSATTTLSKQVDKAFRKHDLHYICTGESYHVLGWEHLSVCVDHEIRAYGGSVWKGVMVGTLRFAFAKCMESHIQEVRQGSPRKNQHQPTRTDGGKPTTPSRSSNGTGAGAASQSKTPFSLQAMELTRSKMGDARSVNEDGGRLVGWSAVTVKGDTLRVMWFYQRTSMHKQGLIWFYILRKGIEICFDLKPDGVTHVDLGPSNTDNVKQLKAKYGFHSTEQWRKVGHSDNCGNCNSNGNSNGGDKSNQNDRDQPPECKPLVEFPAKTTLDAGAPRLQACTLENYTNSTSEADTTDPSSQIPSLVCDYDGPFVSLAKFVTA